MFFVVMAWDRPGLTELRKATKLLHKAHLDQGDASVRVLQSGPLLSRAGVEEGSLIVAAAGDEDTVRSFMKRDPYVVAGLFESMAVHRWSWVRGNAYLPQTQPQQRTND